MPYLALSPVHTGDADMFVAEFGDSHLKRRLSPFSVTVAKNGDYSRQCGQGFTLLRLKGAVAVQVDCHGSRVGGGLALFYIHQMTLVCNYSC